MQKKKARSAVTASRSGRGRSGARKAARTTSSPRLDEEAPSKGLLIGYARGSTIDQNLGFQRDAIAEARCGNDFHRAIVGRGYGSTSFARRLGIRAQRRRPDRMEARVR